jgi:hypothetical protein
MGSKKKFTSRMLKIAALFCMASAIAGNAGAGSSDWSLITGVLPHTGGFFFNSSGTRSSAPSCATLTNRWVINTTTSQGQAMVAALLSAYMAHKRIMVVGTGNCDVWGDTETVNYFQIED